MLLGLVSSKIDQGSRGPSYSEPVDLAPVDGFEPLHLVDPMRVAPDVSVRADRQVEWRAERIPVETVQGGGRETAHDDITADIEQERSKLCSGTVIGSDEAERIRS